MSETQIDAYPLCWPDGHPRTPSSARRWGQFKVTAGAALDDLRAEVERLGGRRLIVSTNIPVRRDGMPYANGKEPSDSGVAIYFDWDGTQRAMACDAYDRVWKNIRALALCIDALRALERHGSSTILERAFRGFAALPEHASALIPATPWFDVLGVDAGAAADAIEAAFRRAALTTHPDKSGTDEQMARLTAAREAGLRATGAVA